MQSYEELYNRYIILHDNNMKLNEEFEGIKDTYKNLQTSYEQLNKTYDELNNSYDELNSSYHEVKDSYEELKSSYNELNESYKENTIIQSMNDMKRKYDNLVLNSVPSYKYKLLTTKYEELLKVSTSADVIINHAVKLLKTLENNSSYDSNTVYKIELELIILKEIIDDVIECNK